MILFNSLYENYLHTTFFILTYFFLECRATFIISEIISILYLQFYSPLFYIVICDYFIT